MKALIVNTTPIARETLGDALDDTILHGLCEAREWLESLGIGSGVSYVEPYVTYPSTRNCRKASRRAHSSSSSTTTTPSSTATSSRRA